jgi:hypothetical protein
MTNFTVQDQHEANKSGEETKFTRGPWEICMSDFYNEMTDSSLVIRDKDGWGICHMCDGIEGNIGEIMAHNANLIAQAPAMYKAISDLLKKTIDFYNRSCAAVARHNNCDGVGIYFDYAPMPVLPQYVEEFRKILASVNCETWQNIKQSQRPKATNSTIQMGNMSSHPISDAELRAAFAAGWAMRMNMKGSELEAAFTAWQEGRTKE